MSPRAKPRSAVAPGSRIDRLALRLAKRSAMPVGARSSAVDGPAQQSRRAVLTRALGASALVMLPLRLVNPTRAAADASCAAQCLADANNAADQRLSKCFVSAFGVDFPDTKAVPPYVAAKIRSGGLGALLLLNELAAFDRCAVVKELRYYYDTSQCAKPNCGDPKKYPPSTNSTCQDCKAGWHCCVCRDYNDGKPLPNLLVNGGYSCATYCTTLGFTVISDTPC